MIRSATDHYAFHLARYYSWMTSYAPEHSQMWADWLQQHSLNAPDVGASALDLGCGHGLWTRACALAGYDVLGVDLSQLLLDEAATNTEGMNVTLRNNELSAELQAQTDALDLVVCTTDTILHLPDLDTVNTVLDLIVARLKPTGAAVFTLRDYTTVPQPAERFIPLAASDSRIAAVMLDFTDTTIIVTDILMERDSEGMWSSTAASYPKLRITPTVLASALAHRGCEVTMQRFDGGLVALIARPAAL